MSPEICRVEEGFESTLWVNGERHPVYLIWISRSHVELMVEEGVVLEEEQLVALLARSFLSLPLRVKSIAGQHIVLCFVQTPHRTVIELLRRDVLASGIDAAIEAAEEEAMPGLFVGDLEVWDEDGHEDDEVEHAQAA